MDYTILRTLEPPPSYMFPWQRRFDLPKNPHLDYVNPGIGFLTKSFDFYVPIYGNVFPHPIQKTIANEEVSIQKDNNLLNIQEGKGSDEVETVEVKNDNSAIQSNVIENPPENKLSENRKRLADSIFDAFMHPKIKTSKIQLPTSQSSSRKLPKHKFNVV